MSDLAPTAHVQLSARSSRPHRRLLRSIGAVLAGLLANIVLAGAIDFTLYATGIYPPRPQPMAEHLWALAFSYRVIMAILGGFLTARLAPSLPMRHAMVLGGINIVLSALCVVADWNKPEFGPHWFAFSMTIASLPLAALGGLLNAKQATRTRP